MRTYRSLNLYVGAMLAAALLVGRALWWGARGALGVVGWLALAALDRYGERSPPP